MRLLTSSMLTTGSRFLLKAAALLLFMPWLQAQDLETFYEKSGYKETPRYDKTTRYCRQLTNLSNDILYTSFGKSAQGRDLPLLIVNKGGNFSPAAAREGGKVVVLVQACIHAGEPDGKDAGLMLIRDLFINKQPEELLDNLILLFIPIFNVDGHERFGPFNRINQNGPAEMGWRTNAQNLNLNRDFLKAESPEMRAWLNLFQEWLPDFIVDCHVTDGADYQYAITYSMETSGNMDEQLTRWQKNSFLPALEQKMKGSGFPIIPYVAFRNWHDPRSGLQSWASPPMFSTGYSAVQNRPGLLIETHMLKDYKTRVSATYEMLRHSLAYLNQHHAELKNLVKEADRLAAETLPGNPLPVSWDLSRQDSTMIDFLGYDYSIVQSDLSGGDWFQYSDKPRTLKIPWFNKVIPASTVTLPEAYLIPPEWTEVIQLIQFHGIRSFRLTKDSKIDVSTYHFKDISFRNTPFEGRMTCSFRCDTISTEVIFPVGTVVVETRQRAARLIAAMMEPQAASSLAYWGYFNTIFEQKEYAESYVMEKMAREMLEKDPALRGEFEKKKETDAAFAKSPRLMLNWFYAKTPYKDSFKDVYPIGRLHDRTQLQSIKP